MRVGTQRLFRLYLKTFVALFLPARLTAPGSPRMRKVQKLILSRRFGDLYPRGSIPLYKPCRYVRPQQVGFLHLFGLKTGIDFAYFGLELGMVF